jgi:trans-2,3-dihydro-3-hydroxyanthranilate isomerase
MERSWLVTIVDACLRGGAGGSPTAVLADDSGLDDRARCRMARVTGTSHTVFVKTGDHGPVAVRFFTAAGELPACGHGTVAALAFLARDDRELRAELRTAARSFTGNVGRDHNGIGASFDAGVAAVRKATDAERDLVLDAFGSESEIDTTGVCAASLGRERLLVPVYSRSALAGLAPNFERLRNESDRLGLLGCYVYSAPSPTGRLSARMFAPSIGVCEDIANVNSTACLAAMLARKGVSEITVDMGDSLGSPATMTACAQREGEGIRVGGLARIAATRRVSVPELYRGSRSASC